MERRISGKMDEAVSSEAYFMASFGIRIAQTNVPITRQSYISCNTPLVLHIVAVSLRQQIKDDRLRECIQKFPDWPPGARAAKWYSSLPLGAVVSLFCESV
jgi:hypothetical protein